LLNPDYVLLARVSVGVQLATVVLLAAFFVALTRTVRLQEVRLWAAAWAADAVALTAVFFASLLVPPNSFARVFICVYIAGKTTYALLVISGAKNHLRPGGSEPLRPGKLALVVAVWSAALAVFAPKLVDAQVATYLVVGGVLSTGAVWVLRRPRFPRSRWLGVGLLVEGLLFLHYVPMLLLQLWGRRPLVSYMYYSSFFDAGAELLVALAILVVVESSFSEHLEHLNGELVASQERLRQLVDLDPLTSLSNRRRLRAEFDRAKPKGAAVIFLDIDDFKEINDRFGHIVGDACLLRLATALARVFRTDDALFRLGGDEFLVVAPGLDAEAAQNRVGRVRGMLAVSENSVPPCQLSVGIAALAPEGEPDAALQEADERMYREKRLRKGSGALRHGSVFSHLPT
jgi:diguanylate cyclase (GGDEF)-like protein